MQKFMVIRTTLALGALVLSTGCASIMSPPYSGYPVTTTPPGATVMVNGYSYKSTPLVLAARRNNPHMIRVEREGCPAFDTVVTSRLSPWVWGNIIFGGLIGLAIDVSSEAAYELEPSHVAIHYGEENGKCVITGTNIAVAQLVQEEQTVKPAVASTGYMAPMGH